MIVDINTKVTPVKDSILIYNGKQYEPISINELTAPLIKRLDNLDNDIAIYKQDIARQNDYIKKLEYKLDGKVKRFINVFRGGKL